MKKTFRKIIPIFVFTLIFVSILMICCIKYNGKSADKNHRNETVDTPHVTAQQTKSHVFHSGEMHGVWIPYFSISDEKELSESEFKEKFDSMIQTAKKHDINTLFVHIRSHCDAAYPSEIFPYAKIYLNGGEEPSYNPLEYMVCAAHKAGLEFHAWINPYRITSESTEIPEDSPCKKWEGTGNVIEYNGGMYLNPASAEVRSLIIDGVRELAENYDIDGVHLDDYFYAFSESEYDEADYREYLDSLSPKSEPLSLEQWRYANVNVLVSGLYAAVKNADMQMLFGISPQGNIGNNAKLSADIYSWCSENGYIDYIAPQIYFNSENPVCPFEKTVDDWQDLIKSDNIRYYVGLALYKAGSEDYDNGTWLNSDDIIASQIEYTRKSGADGFILYSYDYLENEQTAEEMKNYDSIIN